MPCAESNRDEARDNAKYFAIVSLALSMVNGIWEHGEYMHGVSLTPAEPTDSQKYVNSMNQEQNDEIKIAKREEKNAIVSQTQFTPLKRISSFFVQRGTAIQRNGNGDVHITASTHSAETMSNVVFDSPFRLSCRNETAKTLHNDSVSARHEPTLADFSTVILLALD